VEERIAFSAILVIIYFILSVIQLELDVLIGILMDHVIGVNMDIEMLEDGVFHALVLLVVMLIVKYHAKMLIIREMETI